MTKKTILIVGAVLCLYRGHAQAYNGPEYVRGKIYIDTRLQNLNLGTILNYKDTTAFLSDFNNKLIILAFWFTGCTVCIAQFPKEDSLQQRFGNALQILPVTFESKKSVAAFLNRWENTHQQKLSLPFIVADSVLNTLFENVYFPHYVWIAQDRRVIAHTSEYFLTAENIEAMLRETAPIKAPVEQGRR